VTDIPTGGDVFDWISEGRNQTLTVRRVAKDGSWADVFTYDNKTLTSMSRRIRLPLHQNWRKRRV
jgi:hypothetical protein